MLQIIPLKASPQVGGLRVPGEPSLSAILSRPQTDEWRRYLGSLSLRLFGSQLLTSFLDDSHPSWGFRVTGQKGVIFTVLFLNSWPTVYEHEILNDFPPPAVVCGYLLPSNRQLEHLECSFSRGTRKGRCKETQVGLNYFIVIFILLFPKYLLISYHSSSTIESAKDKTVGKDRHNYWAHKKYSLFWILGENRSRVQAEDLLGIYSL